jgi:hypothetical protein
MDLHFKAVVVARIFDILAWLAVMAGGLLAFIGLANVVFGVFPLGIMLMLIAVVATVVSWAGATLGAVMAGYVARETASN